MGDQHRVGQREHDVAGGNGAPSRTMPGSTKPPDSGRSCARSGGHTTPRATTLEGTGTTNNAAPAAAATRTAVAAARRLAPGRAEPCTDRSSAASATLPSHPSNARAASHPSSHDWRPIQNTRASSRPSR